MAYERANIQAMQGYAWGEQPDDGKTIKLNTNENPYPPSPAVAAALAGFSAARLRTYPQPTADMLRDAIAKRHRLYRDQVLVTRGGDEALRLAVTTFAPPGLPLGYAEPSYSLYPVLAAIQDAPLHQAAYRSDWRLPDDFAEAANRAGVRLSCVVNPHAPSGSLLSAAACAALADALDGVLLLDEAYVDFVDPALGHDTVRLLRHADNLLILRSFSKGYSLAGVRLGYLIGAPDLISPMLTKTRDSYNVDALGQALGLAAWQDRAHAEASWTQVRSERARLHQALAERGFKAPESQANFLLAEAPEGQQSARDLYLALKREGILVRHFNTPRMRHYLRISIGMPDHNDRLLQALDRILARDVSA